VRNKSGFSWRRIALLCGLLLAFRSGPSAAQPLEIPPTWGGDLLDRPRLTGNWGGVRDDLARKGIVLDVDLTVAPQGVWAGGRQNGSGLWGYATYTLNLDTAKAGLWPGGYFRFSASSSFGQSVSRMAATMIPVNTAYLVPEFGQLATGLENATFTQLFSQHFGLVAGKMFTLDAAAGEFTGNYRTQFMNTALAFPTALALVPLSAFGGGAIVMPSHDIVLSLTALDPTGTVMSNDLSKAFNSGVMLLAGAKITVRPFDLLGHQSLTGMWSNNERVSLIQDPLNSAQSLSGAGYPLLGDPGSFLLPLLNRYFPRQASTGSLNYESSTWAIVYGFDQYFWQPAGDPKRGIGMFFNFGATDGHANPVQYSWNMGIGMKGLVPGRPDDTAGIGWARTQFSNHFMPFLRDRLDLGLRREDALEMFYNAALTPWMNLSLDLQVVKPGLQKIAASDGGLQNLNTTVIGGLRLRTRF